MLGLGYIQARDIRCLRIRAAAVPVYLSALLRDNLDSSTLVTG